MRSTTLRLVNDDQTRVYQLGDEPDDTTDLFDLFAQAYNSDDRLVRTSHLVTTFTSPTSSPLAIEGRYVYGNFLPHIDGIMRDAAPEALRIGRPTRGDSTAHTYQNAGIAHLCITMPEIALTGRRLKRWSRKPWYEELVTQVDSILLTSDGRITMH